ncbi:hypothetical protein Pelo_9494 [Pelomyxa schiedti]|nr:hypothetical protein Pelo_9494 [Pelomyxa schiedti]
MASTTTASSSVTAQQQHKLSRYVDMSRHPSQPPSPSPSSPSSVTSSSTSITTTTKPPQEQEQEQQQEQQWEWEIALAPIGEANVGKATFASRLDYPDANYRVEALVFNKSAVNELVAVVRDLHSPDKYVFAVIDVERSFSSRSLCLCSETSIKVDKGSVVTTVIVMYRAGFRCFIGKVNQTPFSHCIQFSENEPDVVVLPQVANIQKISRLSATLFVVVPFHHGHGTSWLCEIWDCNELTSPILTVSQPSGYISGPETEAGLLFYIVGNDLRVTEPLTGVTVLSVTLPSKGRYLLGSPFCFP